MTPGRPFAGSGPARRSTAARAVSPVLLWPTGAAGGPTRAAELGQCARRLRCADSRASSRAWVEPSAIGHAGGRGAETRRLPMGGEETHAVAAVLATTRCAPRTRSHPLRAPSARPNGSGKPSTMRTVTTLTAQSGPCCSALRAASSSSIPTIVMTLLVSRTSGSRHNLLAVVDRDRA